MDQLFALGNVPDRSAAIALIRREGAPLGGPTAKTIIMCTRYP